MDESDSVYSDDISDDSQLDIKDPQGPTTPKKGAAMLSLLSYYGIQDNVTNEDIAKNPEAFIDLPQFDPTSYARKLLIEAPMEELLSRDTQLVQDIRTLDSDMQMLVYENYNKFISATETIKRMKINVEVMDEDMAVVKQKMEKICEDSVALDSSLHDQRMKVDKIMRIKRLLNRLEFLTELPERLQEMITREMYQKAVTLYNKTINVLTKHSGVLSLKNIKERTELMMIDLRIKVTNLLDDPTLDTTKLTQYVTILRMMQAPKPMVVQKLIAAHVSRARSMIKSFQSSENETASLSSSNDPNSPSKSVSAGLAVSRTRKFHQLLVAGLIDACKGIHELFCNSEYLTSDSNHENSVPSSGSMINITQPQDSFEKDMKDHENAHKLLVSAVEDVIVSNYSSIMINQVAGFFHEYRMKSNEVKHLEAKIKLLNESTLHDGTSSDGADERSIINESSREPSEKENLDRNIRMLQLRLYDLEFECQNWLLLARQSILDLLYLETTIIECSPLQNGNRLRRLSSDSTYLSSAASSSSSSSTLKPMHFEASSVTFGKSFATQLLDIIGHHVDYLFWRRMISFSEAVQTTSQSIMKLTDLTVNVGTNSHDVSASQSRQNLTTISEHGLEISSHGGSGDPLSVRYEVQRRVGEVKGLFDKLFDHIVSVFSDILTDIKPIIDVYHTVLPPSKSSKSGHHTPSTDLIPNTISGFTSLRDQKSSSNSNSSSNSSSSTATTSLSHSYHSENKSIRNIQRNIIGVDLSQIKTSGGNLDALSHDYVKYLVWSYCSAISQVLEVQGNVSYGTRIFSSTLGSFMPDNDDGIADTESSFLSDVSSTSSAPSTSKPLIVSSQLNSSSTTSKILSIANDDVMFMIEQVLQSSNRTNNENITMLKKSTADDHLFKKTLYVLVSSNLLKRISPTILRRLDGELKNLELAHISKDSIFKAKCAARLELSAQELLSSFVEISCEVSRTLAIHATVEISKSVRLVSPSVTNLEELILYSKDGVVSNRVIDLCQLMHVLCLSCCIILGETPPQLRVPAGGSSTYSSTSGGGGRRTTRTSLLPGGSNTAVHLDIERLFSQKIRVYDFGPAVSNLTSIQVSTSANNVGGAGAGAGGGRDHQLVPTLDVIVGTFVKSSIKAMHEYVRFLSIPHLLYLRLQVQVSVIKQMAIYTLRELTEVESLIDQLNSTMFSRYLDANNISNFIGGSNSSNDNEMVLVSRAVNEAMQNISSAATLLPKHS